MKLPNQRTATIGDMLIFTSQQNGKVRSKKASAIISYCLVNIADLQPLSAVPWYSRKWAVPTWREIKRIGVYDKLELITPPSPLPLLSTPVPASRVRELCSLLGFYCNKINNRTVITRQQLAQQAQATSNTCDAEPCLDMEIDRNAKPTQPWTVPGMP